MATLAPERLPAVSERFSSMVRAMELAEIHEVVAEPACAATTSATRSSAGPWSRSCAVAGRPLSMPSILEQSPGMAQSSVYRNLAVLEHAVDRAPHRHQRRPRRVRAGRGPQQPPPPPDLLELRGDRGLRRPRTWSSELGRTVKSVARRRRFTVSTHVARPVRNLPELRRRLRRRGFARGRRPAGELQQRGRRRRRDRVVDRPVALPAEHDGGQPDAGTTASRSRSSGGRLNMADTHQADEHADDHRSRC